MQDSGLSSKIRSSCKWPGGSSKICQRIESCGVDGSGTVTVKPSQAYPPRFYQWIDYLKNESVSRSCNWCQIQSGISACAMSSEYFTRTSLYLVRLEIFEWIKLLRRHLHQFQENGAGRNFITASRVNSRLTTHARVQRSIWNLQLATDSTFE